MTFKRFCKDVSYVVLHSSYFLVLYTFFVAWFNEGMKVTIYINEYGEAVYFLIAISMSFTYVMYNFIKEVV